MELNPNHPVTKAAHDQWHKIAALLMIKFGQTDVQITPEDVGKIANGNVNILLDERGAGATGCFMIRIVDDKTAHELARREGGGPAPV